MALAYLLPKYWITWAGLGVMRVVELLPYTLQTHVGDAIGCLLRHLPLSYLRIARRNIALCLPELSAAEREKLLDRHCRSLGMALCETADTWWSSDKRLNQLAEVQGLHHLEAALAKGRSKPESPCRLNSIIALPRVARTGYANSDGSPRYV